ncbi:zinc finger, C3HC4 type (RING finger) domain-containing protein [Besnoitia besnoiti]|uniref:RING-type E3 ubiquitin transferase n=1 Tax=Besnoitia besnoiti TaxID=94643 RepID=A0A2A9MJ91_BESBE|nr:zinc finger, C3HC4 type (RING finger) domain-containing protein [Besnoitia besnoiti]PFH36036.1 zinc finger, C3HC4 type (RING finger) domain-containing protein [Besnoitia besnoiti]
MAGVRVRFHTYALVSLLSVVALLLRTWYLHEEFYTVVAVLSTGKIALALLYNFALMLFLGLGKLAVRLMVGHLRDLEVEQILDSGRGFLLDTVLFLVLSSPTLEGSEVSSYALAKFLFIVVSLKTAHLVVQIRGSTMFEVGHPRAGVLLRLCVVLFCLLLLDFCAVHFFFVHASKASTFYLWLLFECLGMLVSSAISILKFAAHIIDVRLDNGWASKSAVLFYLELIHDVTSLVIFLLFMSVFFITQPSRLPLYMTADIIHVVKALYKRILSFKKYRALTKNLETRFPDATADELEAADTCIICRDLLFEGSKKLPCSHIFHIDCLRSWLVQQQSCPTCRAEIPTDDSAAQSPAQAHTGAAEQRSEGERGGDRPPPSVAAAAAAPPTDQPAGGYAGQQSETEAQQKGTARFVEDPRGEVERTDALPAGVGAPRLEAPWSSHSGNASVAQALLQGFQLACQTCEFYRFHASLWMIEAQRAQLEASRLQALRSCQATQHIRTWGAHTQISATPQSPSGDGLAAATPASESEADAAPAPHAAAPSNGREFIVVCPSHLFYQQSNAALPHPPGLPSVMPPFETTQMPSAFGGFPFVASNVALPRPDQYGVANAEWLRPVPGDTSAAAASEQGPLSQTLPGFQPPVFQQLWPQSRGYYSGSPYAPAGAATATHPASLQPTAATVCAENTILVGGQGNVEEARTREGGQDSRRKL